jgi:hypothetical protein
METAGGRKTVVDPELMVIATEWTEFVTLPRPVLKKGFVI